MAWLSPVTSSTGLANGSRTSWSPSAVLYPQLHAVAVQAERPDPAAAQRRRKPVGEAVDHLAVGGLEVLQPAGLERAERIGSRVEQRADADGLGAGGVGDHDGVDLQPHQRIGRVTARGWASVFTCSRAGFGFSVAIRSSRPATSRTGRDAVGR